MMQTDGRDHGRDERRRDRGSHAVARLLALAVLLGLSAAAWADTDPAETAPASAPNAGETLESVAVEISGMTFVASRDDESELLVRADEATFLPDERRANLSGVHATVTREGKGERFEMRCERGTLDLETNHFRATGNVRGRTNDGREFETDWVRYDHIAGMLSTRAPVVINDSGITYRGGGFDYDIEGQRFKLIGGASVVQDR